MYAVGMDGSSIGGKNGEGVYQRSMVIRDIKPKGAEFGMVWGNPLGAESIRSS